MRRTLAALILSASALFGQAGNSGYGVGGGSGTGSYTFSAPLSLSGSTVSLGASGVTGGSYTCLNATVNTQGLITTATSGTCTGGSGTVTHTVGALTANQLVFGNGAGDIAVGDLTGDVTTSGGKATTLAAVNSSPGSYGSSSIIPVLTIDGKGRITAVTTAAASSGFGNPMTTTGDLIVGGTSGVATRLAAGTSGYSLVSNGPGVAPSWTLITGGGGGGNIVVASLPGTCTQGSTYFLTTGTPNQQLYDCTASNTFVQHGLVGPTGALSVNASTGATDIVTSVVPRIAAANAFTGRNSYDSASDMKIQAAPASPASGYLALYANSDGSLHYKNSAGTDAALATGSGFANPMTTLDDVIVGGASGAASRLAKGADSQVLGIDPATHHVAYINQTGGGTPGGSSGQLQVNSAGAFAGSSLSQDTDSNVSMTSTGSQSKFCLNNTGASAGGIHNVCFFSDTNWPFAITDNTTTTPAYSIFGFINNFASVSGPSLIIRNGIWLDGSNQARPTCGAGGGVPEGYQWYTPSSAGVAGTFAVCGTDAAGVSAWHTIF